MIQLLEPAPEADSIRGYYDYCCGWLPVGCVTCLLPSAVLQLWTTWSALHFMSTNYRCTILSRPICLGGLTSRCVW